MITYIDKSLIQKLLRIKYVNGEMPYFLTRFWYKNYDFSKFRSVQLIPVSITVITLQYYTYLDFKVSVKRININ